MTLRVGLIGLGTMGRTHAAAYQRMPNVELVAVADLRPELTQPYKDRGIAVYSDGRALIEQADVDVIDVCLPTFLHRPFVELAAAKGRHVFCEKPLARTYEDGLAMVEACRRAGVKFAVGHVVRFSPQYVKAKEIVDSGQIGQPVTVSTMRGGGGFPRGWQDWYANFEWSGGLVLDLIIHDFDYLRWVFGEVERVFARGTAGREYNRYEYALASIRFKNGVIANVEGSWFDHGGFQTHMEIAGEKGLLSHNSVDASPLLTVLQTTEAAEGVPVPKSPLVNSPYQLELQHFISCIERDEEPLTSGEEALKSLQVSLAAMESIATGKPVEL
ncbi:MAG: Gfo/Idh/MocA family oxidoreductase [Firmicutes bacterium]|nr:Gfo/Idh/MocA family oxidoreductase [Bacillota bacterium]